MFVFPGQEVFNVGGLRFGGQMVNPCKMVATVFYRREGVFLDGGFSRFDRRLAGLLIEDFEAVGLEYGIESMLDVFAESGDDMVERIDFVCSRTDMPFMVDSTDAEVRMRGVEFAEEVGVVDRVVYNSINAGIKEPEIEFLSASKLNAAVVLAFNPVDRSLKGKVDILENGSKLLDSGLLDIARRSGVRKVLIDTGVTPLGDGAGVSCHAITVLKSRFGLPTGNGVHNVVSGLKGRLIGKDGGCLDASLHAVSRVLGADFLMFGPIENAKKIYPVMALTEAVVGESLMGRGFCLDGGHPLSKLMSGV
ncbi:MAG: hypothetical protein V1921_01720 [Candidatus Altiarchaeota archaeon]